MSDQACIVAIGAHAADMEFSTGAALLKHAQAGWDAHIIHLTLGETGSANQSPEAYGAQKRAEAEAAATVLQVTPHFLPFADGELFATEEAALTVARLLRQFLAGIRHFDLDGLPPMRWARLYFADNWEDPDHFRPYHFVDVTEVMEQWKAAFDCFAIGRGEGGFPYWDWYQARTRLHGIALRTGHAMGFAVDEARMMQQRELL